MPKGTYLMMDVEASGISATVEFNGVTLVNEDCFDTLRHSSKVNGWAVEGDNCVEVYLALLPHRQHRDATEKNQKKVLPRFMLRLRETMAGQDDASDYCFIDYRWDGKAALLTLGGGKVFEQHVSLKAAATWSWVRSERISSLSQDETEAIVELMERLHGAFNRKHVSEIVALQQVQITEQAVALGLDPQQNLDEYRAFLQYQMSSPECIMLPLRTESLRMKKQAGGRLHRVTDAEGNPPIVTMSGEDTFAVDPYVAKVDGRWIVVR